MKKILLAAALLSANAFASDIQFVVEGTKEQPQQVVLTFKVKEALDLPQFGQVWVSDPRFESSVPVDGYSTFLLVKDQATADAVCNLYGAQSADLERTETTRANCRQSLVFNPATGRWGVARVENHCVYTTVIYGQLVCNR